MVSSSSSSFDQLLDVQLVNVGVVAIAFAPGAAGKPASCF